MWVGVCSDMKLLHFEINWMFRLKTFGNQGELGKLKLNSSTIYGHKRAIMCTYEHTVGYKMSSRQDLWETYQFGA